jgi:hypothetical protein
MFNRCPAAFLLGFFLTVCLALSAAQAVSGRLRVSENGRYLEQQDGKPFFYLGDTAWELFHRLNRDEADRYLADRARKGFTVIQAVVLAELGGLDVPNANGDLPLVAGDPTRPNERYFEHVDYIVDRAANLGLFIGMLPTWGSYWVAGEKKIFNEQNARHFGRFLGTRYRERPIIWILGGDANPGSQEETSLISAMAAGLREGDGGAHLITFHPRGPGLSSDYFHLSKWLDFNMYQSSHAARDHDNGLFADRDYKLQPPKPTLDGEPRYERIPVGFYFSNMNRYDRFDDYDSRQAAYWSLLAGSCGHTYGNNNIWQMWAHGRPPIIFADIPWYESLDHPGAFQMGYVRRLFDSRPFPLLEPYQKMIVDGPRDGGAKLRAARARDGSFAFVYSPRGEKITVDKDAIRGVRIKEIWYDPRYGIAHHIHTGNTKGIQTYTPPSSGRGFDWILILEDESAAFPLPGSSRSSPDSLGTTGARNPESLAIRAVPATRGVIQAAHDG